jgi:hypothetical protein
MMIADFLGDAKLKVLLSFKLGLPVKNQAEIFSKNLWQNVENIKSNVSAPILDSRQNCGD